MSPIKIALALTAAAALNGSVAQAMTLPSCADRPVCALPLGDEGGQVHRARLDLPAEAALSGDERPLASLAPPRRPAGLTDPLRRPSAAVADIAVDRAALAPPPRPAGRWPLPAPH